MWWSCPRWHRDKDIPAEIVDSNGLGTQAAEEVKDFPVFWLRGLPPQVWYDKVLAPYPVPQESWEHCCWGCLLN